MGSTNSIRRITFENDFAFAATKSINEDTPVMQIKKDNRQSPHLQVLPQGNENSFEILGKDHVSYWTSRIEELKREHQIINNIKETEFTKTIQKTQELYETPKPLREKIDRIKPCSREWRSKIIKCYEENRHQPLKCSDLVKAFNEYVSTYRLEE